MEKRDKINIKDKNIIDFFFLKTENNSYIAVKRIKNKKNTKKYPPFITKKIDKGKIISEVKILFCKLVIFFQSFF